MPIPSKAWLAIVATVAAYALVRETVWPSLPILQRHWQVPRYWMRAYWRGPIAFGLIMGSGLFTYIPTALYYVYMASCMASRAPAEGAFLGACYGVSYSLAFIYGAGTFAKNRPESYLASGQSISRRLGWLGALAAPLACATPFAHLL